MCLLDVVSAFAAICAIGVELLMPIRNEIATPATQA
jgi:hypothetical protein